MASAPTGIDYVFQHPFKNKALFHYMYEIVRSGGLEASAPSGPEPDFAFSAPLLQIGAEVRASSRERSYHAELRASSRGRPYLTEVQTGSRGRSYYRMVRASSLGRPYDAAIKDAPYDTELHTGGADHQPSTILL